MTQNDSEANIIICPACGSSNTKGDKKGKWLDCAACGEIFWISSINGPLSEPSSFKPRPSVVDINVDYPPRESVRNATNRNVSEAMKIVEKARMQEPRKDKTVLMVETGNTEEIFHIEKEWTMNGIPEDGDWVHISDGDGVLPQFLKVIFVYWKQDYLYSKRVIVLEKYHIPYTQWNSCKLQWSRAGFCDNENVHSCLEHHDESEPVI